jgi:hypothetical protein
MEQVTRFRIFVRSDLKTAARSVGAVSAIATGGAEGVVFGFEAVGVASRLLLPGLSRDSSFTTIAGIGDVLGGGILCCKFAAKSWALALGVEDGGRLSGKNG